MLSDTQIEVLVSRVVAITALYLQGGILSSDPSRDREIASRSRNALGWMELRLDERGKEALKDLEKEPGSADNQADLRKQLRKLLETQTSIVDLAEELNHIIPESLGRDMMHSGDINTGDIISALKIANNAIGLFKKRYDPE